MHKLTGFLIVACTAVLVECHLGPFFPGPPSIACEAGSTLNPYTNTCLRPVTDKKTWDDAKAFCEAAGEYLAVLEDVNSVNWFEHIRRTQAVWKNAGWLWFAGRREASPSEIWSWHGITVGEMNAADWEDSQTDGTGDCLQLFNGPRNYKWDDYGCTNTNNFVCEKWLFRHPHGHRRGRP